MLRSVMLSGRRYEQFDSADAFRRFAERSWQSLALAKPIVEQHGVKLAIENHKDSRVPDLLDILKRIDSPNIGVCLDTGNSIALLEEPHEVVEAYAPFTFTTHFKDMAVAAYEEGFLLSEVPLGTGFVDLPRVIAAVRKHRPGGKTESRDDYPRSTSRAVPGRQILGDVRIAQRARVRPVSWPWSAKKRGRSHYPASLTSASTTSLLARTKMCRRV